jgi:hypothetical protein
MFFDGFEDPAGVRAVSAWSQARSRLPSIKKPTTCVSNPSLSCMPLDVWTFCPMFGRGWDDAFLSLSRCDDAWQGSHCV